MKKGFTLIELLVYVSLLGVIIVIAGRVFSDSTSFRLRTQNMLKATEEATKVAALIEEDLASMGSKSWKVAGASDSFRVESSVYVDPDNASDAFKDSSSFLLTRSGDGKDSIIFRRVEYHADGSFFAVQEITWFLRGKSIWRSCKTTKGTATTVCSNDAIPTPVLMAENVETFSLTPATPGLGPDTLFPSSAGAGFRLIPRVGGHFVGGTVDPSVPGDVGITISGFANNYDMATESPDYSSKNVNEIYVAPKTSNAGNWVSLCKEFTFLPKTPYLISMKIPYMSNEIRMFRPEFDHMAIGLRKKNGSSISGISDYFLYPSLSDSSKVQRNIEMMFSDTVKACLAFTFAFYSPVASKGAIKIEDFTVLHLSNRSYTFIDSPSGNITDVTRKKDVKAFKLELIVNNRGESGEVKSIIPVLNNGEKANSTPVS